MPRKKVLFICGSLNQTTQMHQIAREMPGADCFFTPYYCDGAWIPLQKVGLLDFTIVGGQNRDKTERYFREHRLPVDYAGRSFRYDLRLTCTDLLVQRNTRDAPLVLVQEGMTDPENAVYQLVKLTHRFGVPRWLASTSTTGLSDAYDFFCVASEGYRRHFEGKGVKPSKIRVTGIPNFDNCAAYLDNDFPHRGYVLVATTDTRENFKWDNRARFLREAVRIAAGRQLLFKLHPNEDPSRSSREIRRVAPDAIIYTTGNTNHMVANSDVLITQYSSVVYVGLALGKEVHSYFDLEALTAMAPEQNGGTSGRRIADVCREFL